MLFIQRLDPVLKNYEVILELIPYDGTGHNQR